MRIRHTDVLLGILACGLSSWAVGCSGSGPAVPAGAGWPKPPAARVSAAAQLAYPTHAICHEGDEQYHDYDQSTWDCNEHPRHCDAPGDTVGVLGCWTISCDVHMAVATKTQGTLDFYGCRRFNGDCSSVTGGCPDGDFVCIEGKGRKLHVDSARSVWYPDACPHDSEVHPNS